MKRRDRRIAKFGHPEIPTVEEEKPITVRLTSLLRGSGSAASPQMEDEMSATLPPSPAPDPDLEDEALPEEFQPEELLPEAEAEADAEADAEAAAETVAAAQSEADTAAPDSLATDTAAPEATENPGATENPEATENSEYLGEIPPAEEEIATQELAPEEGPYFEPAKAEDFYSGSPTDEVYHSVEYDDRDFQPADGTAATTDFYVWENPALPEDGEDEEIDLTTEAVPIPAPLEGSTLDLSPLQPNAPGSATTDPAAPESKASAESNSTPVGPETPAAPETDAEATPEPAAEAAPTSPAGQDEAADGWREDEAQTPVLKRNSKGQIKLPKGRFADRELSWLAFNERVFQQAQDKRLPLLERAWFLTIFASNLDEFYMVRVAGLKRRIAAGIATVAASGLSPRQLDEAISARAHDLMKRVYTYFQDVIRPALAKEGLEILHYRDLPVAEQEHLHGYFRRQIFPVLSPLAVDPSHPFPYISGLSLNLAVIARNPRTGKDHFARVKVPPILPRYLAISPEGVLTNPADKIQAGQAVHFVPIEEVIAAHLDHLFPGMEIVESHAFRVTRNEDLEVEEDDAENLLKAMETELLKRRFGPAVRLEVSEEMSPHVRSFLMRNLEISESDVFAAPAPLDLRGLNVLHDLDLPKLQFKAFVPVTASGLAEVESAKPVDIFQAITKHDVLLHHPYDAFSTSVQQFVVQAARDPHVLAIKQTLYRTSGDSPIVQALIDAAESGKQVVAIVEIKARFDEEANISWARKMERAGVHVVYGMVGLKTHCKLCLVVRQEPDGLKRYCHVGTGNYHPKTARGYEDLGLLTCDPEVAQDLTRLFNQLSGYAPQTSYQRLLVAPRSIRDGLIERIEREVENHKAGLPAWIRFKVNSVVDERVCDALYRASLEGVPVDVQVRGICALQAGLPGLSENLRVYSILGRFLEHSRIYAFGNGGEAEVWIGSADLMHRNLDRRVEALVRIAHPDQIHYLVDLVTRGTSEGTTSWRLTPEQTWVRHTKDAEGKRLEDLQQLLMERASARVARMV